MKDLENTNCNICGKNNTSLFLKKDGFTLVKCTDCGLVYLNPRPSKNYLNALYKNKFHGEMSGPRDKYENFLKHKRRYALDYNLSRLRFVNKYSRGRKLLDVGCACGIFLHLAEKEGYEVQGMEISGDSARIARDKFDLEIHEGRFENNNFDSSSFNIVTMWDVLEHSHDSVRDLKEAYRLLKPKGLLVIQAPNLQGLDVSILTKDWGWLQVPYHLYFFTPSSLKKMVEKTNFKIVAVRTYYVDLWDILLRKVFKRYDAGRESKIIKFYDAEKRKKVFSFAPLRLFKFFLYTIIACLKILFYFPIVFAKKGSLIQVFAVKEGNDDRKK